MVSPEAIGRGAEIEYKKMGYSHGLMDFSNGETDNPLDIGTVTENEFYFALGVSENADLFYKVAEEAPGIFGIKVQVFGTPSKARGEGHKLSFALGIGSNRDEFEGTYDIEIKADASELSVIHGYRLSPMILLYDGITYSKYEFSGSIKNAGTALSSDEFKYTASGILGVHAGAELGGDHFKVKLEYGAQRIKWSHTDPELAHSFGYSLSAAF